MSWKRSDALMQTIKHYANFPATGVSLRQMVQFGEKPSVGMLEPKEDKIPLKGTRVDGITRDIIPGITVPVGRIADTASPQGTRIERTTGWAE